MNQKKPPLHEDQLSQLVRQQSLKKPLRWVVGAHVLFIVVAAIGLPHFRNDEPFDMTQAVVVDLVAPTGEFSAAPNKTKSPKPFVKDSKPKPEEKKPPVANPEKPPSTVKSDAAQKLDVPKPEEKKLEKPKEKVEKPKENPTKKADTKVKLEKPKKEQQKKSRDDGAGSEQEQKEFNSVLKNLLGATDAKVDVPDGNPIDAVHDANTKTEGKAPVTSETLALSEMDALKYQLAQCWNIPSGAMNAEDLVVDLRIEVNPDRTVKSAEIVDQSRYGSDSFFQAAADSARRAVFNPRCTPLALPADKYDVWKVILIRFNPREMFGG